MGETSEQSADLWFTAIVVGVVGMAVGESVTARGLIADGGGDGGVPFSIDGSWLFAAFVLFALAEVWRYGVALQRDVEATV